MNLFGIFGAIALLPKYKAAKKRLDAAETALKNVQSQMALYDSKKGNVDLHPDQNSQLDGIEVQAILRVYNIQSDLNNTSVDGYVIFTNTSKDRSYTIKRIAAQFTIFNYVVRTYIPMGVTTGFVIKPGERVEVELSGVNNITLLASKSERQEVYSKFKGLYGDFKDLAKASVVFYYQGKYGYGQAIRAVYEDVPCIYRRMAAFVPNNKNFPATAGASI